VEAAILLYLDIAVEPRFEHLRMCSSAEPQNLTVDRLVPTVSPVMTVRVRIAPSTTGDPTWGPPTSPVQLRVSQHTAASSFCAIEDQPSPRSTPESERPSARLRWVGLSGQGPDVAAPRSYRQSERADIYRREVANLSLRRGLPFVLQRERLDRCARAEGQ